MSINDIFIKFKLNKIIKKKSITIDEKNQLIINLFNKQYDANSKKRFLKLLSFDILLKISKDRNIINTCYPSLVFMFISNWEKCFKIFEKDLDIISTIIDNINAYHKEISFFDAARDFAFSELLGDIEDIIDVNDRGKLLYIIISEYMLKFANILTSNQIVEYFSKVILFSEIVRYKVNIIILFLRYFKTKDIIFIISVIEYLPDIIKIRYDDTYKRVFFLTHFMTYCERLCISCNIFFETYLALFSTEELISIPKGNLNFIATIIAENPTNIINYGENPIVFLQYLFLSCHKKFTTNHITLMCSVMDKEHAFDLCKIWALEFGGSLDCVNLMTIFGNDLEHINLELFSNFNDSNKKYDLDLQQVYNDAKKVKSIIETAKKNEVSDDAMFNFLLIHSKILNSIELTEYGDYFHNLDTKRKYFDALKKESNKDRIVNFTNSKIKMPVITFYNLKWQIQLEKEEDNNNIINNEDICIICFTNKKKIALIPCGHLRLCATCIFQMLLREKFKCPECRIFCKDILITY